MSESALQVEAPLLSFVSARLGGQRLDRELLAPLRDFLSRPGKLLRARLVAISWELAGGRGEPPAGLSLAVELLHAGSLIVDDIEDCAEQRRGRPALHLLAGLPVALNAGNWLYFAALEELGALALPDRRGLQALRAAHRLLARCHEGQALDVGVRISELAPAEVEPVVRAISERKTGGLASLCTTLAAICAGAPPPVEEALARFGGDLGVGLQLLDDTGAVASEARREKGEEDVRNGRATWAWALAAARVQPSAWRRLQALSTRAQRGERAAGALVDALRGAIGDAGRREARKLLDGALRDLRGALGDQRALEGLSAMVRDMEQSYG